MANYNSDDQAIASLWNFDGAECQLLFEIKTKFINHLLNWDLENAYWAVRTLRMELDAKLVRDLKRKKIFDEDYEEEKNKKKTEKQEVDEMMQELEDIRNQYNQIINPNQNNKGDYFLSLPSAASIPIESVRRKAFALKR